MKKIFTLFAAMLFAASTWAADLPAGNYVYFEKPNDWSVVSLLLGHSSYSIGYNMTSIANTNLYYWKTDKWGGYTEYAFIDANGWGGESGNSAKPGTRKEWAPHKTAAFTTTIAKYHLFTSAGSKSSHASSFETAVNRTQTIQIQVKDGENWTNATTAPATVTATTYALTAETAATQQTATVAAASETTSATVSAAYSATVTLTHTDLAEGYMFIGWFDANGQEISNYTVTDAATVYARFEESAEETNNVTVSYVCNSVSLKESTSLTVGTKTASRVEAPAIDDYIFQSWTLSAGVESADATANPIYITTKTGETEYTLTANYIEVPKVTVYAINSSKWEAIAVHHWVEGGSSTAWPGDLMTKTELQDKNGFDVYSATFVAEHDSCIFNNNGKGAQTKNLTVENGKYYDVKGQQWYASLDEVPFVDPLATNIYLAGGMNEWNATTTMFKKAAADATSASVTLALEAQTYEFKVVVDGQWYGNNGTMTREYHEGWIFRVKQDNGETDEINAKITADIAGEYTFTWNMTENKLTVTYPELPAPHVTLHKVLAGKDLQAVVSQALSGDTVLVQAGTYEGNFTMKEGVFVSGGWNADFTEQTEHASILDAKANGRVLNQPANFETLTIWENFTIQNGKLTEVLSDKLGAGVALLKNGRVINCLVQNNTFTYDPATQCAGGGIAQNSNGDTCAINCIVRNNKATHGGGIRTAGVAINCLVENNEATGNGGGVYLHNIGQLHNSIVRNNVCKKDVGGIDIAAAGGAVYNCLVVGNHADGNIGGVQARKYNNVVNTTIVGNNHNTTTADRVTWAGFRASDNTATNYNGKLFVNNVIWGNTHNDTLVNQVMPYLKHYASNGTFASNALQGTTDLGADYIALSAENDPQFNEDYSFATTSPLYNAGTNDALAYFVGDKDVYGNARKQGANIEIGAVEIAEPTQTIITETFDLTQEEDTRNMGGAYTIYAGDNYTLRIYGYTGAGTYQDDPATEEDAAPQLFTPDYDDALNAVVVVTIDEENNKEVMEVTATSADGLKVYNLTINIALPNTVEHLVVPTEFKVEQVELEPGLVVWNIEGTALMDTEDNVIDFWATVDPTAYMIEAEFGEVYAVGEAAIYDPFMGEIYIESILKDEEGNTYNFSISIPEFKQDVEITVAETVELTGYKLAFEVQGNMANVSAIVGDIELTFAMSLNSEDNGYGTYFNDAIWNVWYGNDANGFVALTPYGDEHVYSAENFKVSFINDPDEEGNVTLYNFTLIPGEKPATPTALDNIDATVAPVKMIENGQLIIMKGDVKFNAQGAIVK